MISFFIKKIFQIVLSKCKTYNQFDYFTDNEKNEFLDSFSTTEEKKKKGRSNSRPDLHPDVVKTAVYIKHLFMVRTSGLFTFNITTDFL